MLMQKIHNYEREAGERGRSEKRARELEDALGKITGELSDMKERIRFKDQEISEYQEKLELMDEI